MYIKELQIEKATGEIIREIHFHNGLNLIVDETPLKNGKETGNNVGKTTVLKLVDFCLGGRARNIYTDQENQKNEYRLVRDFLVENAVIVTLILTEDLDKKDAKTIVIERNFLFRTKRIQRINGLDKTDTEFEEELTAILFPGHFGKKPTFRQIIAHNIRYSDLSLTNTLKNLDRYTRDDEYETLYLFLFGCDFENGDVKQQLRIQIDLEQKFKNRLEIDQTRSAYEAALALLNSEIEELERSKTLIDISPTFEADIDALNAVKYEINRYSYMISNLELRRNIILESQTQMSANASDINLDQLRQVYQQATSLVEGIQKTFENLVAFHNTMIRVRSDFIAQDLPRIEGEISENRRHIDDLIVQERALNSRVTQSDSFEDLGVIIGKLNEKYQKRGEFQNVIDQLARVDSRLADLNKRLAEIDDSLFSSEYRQVILEQVNKFNRHFSRVSNELYGEKYAIKYDEKEVKGRRLYIFSAFNTNFSSGKKQGEISCFDFAYTLFADEEGIPCMHFLLNDKKELMHDNQLVRLGKFADDNRIQFVASILYDKLPTELQKAEYIVLRLSQTDKLFRIENAAG